eukprot:4980202-Amphidinium_carterae.1
MLRPICRRTCSSTWPCKGRQSKSKGIGKSAHARLKHSKVECQIYLMALRFASPTTKAHVLSRLRETCRVARMEL